MIFAQPKFNQFCLGVSLMVGVFDGLAGTVCAHEYEDGFVERSLTITIRDGVGYGEYQIGLNARTATQVLELAEQSRQLVLTATAPRKRRIVAGESASVAEAFRESSVDRNPMVKEPGAGLEVDVTPKDETSKDENPRDETKGVPNQSVGAREHLTDLATIKRFGQLQEHWFAGRLKLTRNGEQVVLSKVAVEPAARHPFSVVVKFQFSVQTEQAAQGAGKPDTPQSSTVDFQVTDGLFSEHYGATRYALRSRGSTMLLQSNVAPVLVRADRVEITRGAGGLEQRRSPEIQAKLLVGSR